MPGKDWSPKAPAWITFQKGNEIIPAKGKYPEDALYVYEVSPDRKSFKASPLGGGPVYTFDLASVGKYGFRFVQPDEIKVSWRKGRFTLDGPVYEGWTTGQLWNGWASPAFEKKVTEQALVDLTKTYREMGETDYMVWWKYDPAADAFRFLEQKDDEPRTVKGFKIKAGGKTRTVYGLGDGWTWSEEAKEEA